MAAAVVDVAVAVAVAQVDDPEAVQVPAPTHAGLRIAAGLVLIAAAETAAVEDDDNQKVAAGHQRLPSIH